MFQNRRLAFMIVLAVVAPAIAFAYPIPPKPLWPLTAEAEMIVVAAVTAVERLPRENDSLVSARAHLRVIETLKGPRMKIVEVPYEANLVCPAPARYAVDETVVAFLEHTERGWRTVSLSYGTLYPKDDELEDVTTMVRAALALQRTPADAGELTNRKREWLVQAAVLPGTRWHGLQGLTSKDRAIYDRDGRSIRLAIDDRHRELLSEAFVEAPKLDHTFATMLQLLPVGNPRVDGLALGVLEQQIALEEPPYWVRGLLLTLLSRWGDTRPESRLERLGVEAWEITPEQLREIWSDARTELSIPGVLPAALEDE